MSCGTKDKFKHAPWLMYYTHHGITDLVNYGKVKNAKREYLESGT